MRKFCLAALVWISGCFAGAPFVLKKELPLQDQSAIQPELGKKHFSKLIVLRPSGTDSARYEAQVASFEREFMRQGVTIISGAITGRVVLGESKTDSTAKLTDIERALIMARSTGAEAILQIGGYDYIERVASRYLVYDQAKDVIREVDRDQYSAWDGRKMFLNSGALRLVGRLIDVSSGEVLASFNVACASSWSLPADLQGNIFFNVSGDPVITSNYPVTGTRHWDAPAARYVEEPPEWERQGRARCEQRLIERLIRVTLSRGVPSSGPGNMLEL